MGFTISRVGTPTPEYIFLNEKSLYSFIYNCKGERYEELKNIALQYYEKENNDNYFGQIITLIRLFGLLRLEVSTDNKSSIVVENKLLEEIYSSDSQELVNEYMDYYLVNCQFPLPNEQNAENRQASIIKPYLIILKILLELKYISSEEAYLTRGDVEELFLDSVINIDEIDTETAQKLIDERDSKCWNDLKNSSYMSGFFKTSSLLTVDQNKFNVKGKFFIGLALDETTEKLSKLFINNYKDKTFYFDPMESYKGLDTINNWGIYVNNVEKFREWRKMSNIIKDVGKFNKFCLKRGFYYEEDLIRRFIVSLETKPFLILTGISGSGKTKIAELWIEYLQVKYNDQENRSLHVSIGSNWNDSKKLLGFKNILLEDSISYIDTDVVRTIIKAGKEADKDYIIILDEMNLSHVERYFADFLSALESRSKEIKLPDGRIISWNENLKIIGTVNIDETTYMFSSKVLDRANVIEMNGKKPSAYIESVIESEEKIYKGIKCEAWFTKYINDLDSIYTAVNQDFGFRVIDEVSKYIKINVEIFGKENIRTYFDEQICQKILPKLHGSKSSLKPKLDALQSLFGDDEDYKLTNKKLQEMQKSVKKGYASFIGE